MRPLTPFCALVWLLLAGLASGYRGYGRFQRKPAAAAVGAAAKFNIVETVSQTVVHQVTVRLGGACGA